MSEPRRVQIISNGFTSGASTSQNQQIKSEKPPKSFRFTLALPETSKTTFPEFSYTDLLSSAEEEAAAAAADAADPFAAQDRASQDKLERIAKQFELKYAPKPGKRKRRDRVEDLVNLGDGYDEEDSFVDNTEAFDEYLPCNVTTKYGGFYVNTGVLDLVPANDDSIDEMPVYKKHKRINDISDESNESSDRSGSSKNNFEKMSEKKKKLVKKNSNDRDRSLSVKNSSDDRQLSVKKKLKNKISKSNGLKSERSKVSGGEINEEGVRVSGASASDKIKVKSVSDKAAAVSAVVHKKPENSSNKVLSSIDSAIDSVISQAKESNDDIDIVLSDKLKDLIDRISNAAKSCEGGMIRKFSEEVNDLLIAVNEECRRLPVEFKTSTMIELGTKFACGREGLLKRIKKLSLTRHDDKLKRPIEELRDAVKKAMPACLARYQTDLAQVEKLRQAQGVSHGPGSSQGRTTEEDSDFEEVGGASAATPGDSGNPVKRINNPRRKFEWTPELRQYLNKVILLKMQHYEMSQIKSQTAEEYLKAFLETEIKPLWDRGWIRTRALLKETRAVHEKWTGGSSAGVAKPAKTNKNNDDGICESQGFRTGETNEEMVVNEYINVGSLSDEKSKKERDKFNAGDNNVNIAEKLTVKSVNDVLTTDRNNTSNENHMDRNVRNSNNNSSTSSKTASKLSNKRNNVTNIGSNSHNNSLPLAGGSNLNSTPTTHAASKSVETSSKTAANQGTVGSASKAGDTPARTTTNSSASKAGNTPARTTTNSADNIREQWAECLSKLDLSHMTPEQIMLLASRGQMGMEASTSQIKSTSQNLSENMRRMSGSGDGLPVKRSKKNRCDSLGASGVKIEEKQVLCSGVTNSVGLVSTAGQNVLNSPVEVKSPISAPSPGRSVTQGEEIRSIWNDVLYSPPVTGVKTQATGTANQKREASSNSSSPSASSSVMGLNSNVVSKSLNLPVRISLPQSSTAVGALPSIPSIAGMAAGKSLEGSDAESNDLDINSHLAKPQASVSGSNRPQQLVRPLPQIAQSRQTPSAVQSLSATVAVTPQTERDRERQVQHELQVAEAKRKYEIFKQQELEKINRREPSEKMAPEPQMWDINLAKSMHPQLSGHSQQLSTAQQLSNARQLSTAQQSLQAQQLSTAQQVATAQQLCTARQLSTAQQLLSTAQQSLHTQQLSTSQQLSTAQQSLHTQQPQNILNTQTDLQQQLLQQIQRYNTQQPLLHNQNNDLLSAVSGFSSGTQLLSGNSNRTSPVRSNNYNGTGSLNTLNTTLNTHRVSQAAGVMSTQSPVLSMAQPAWPLYSTNHTDLQYNMNVTGAQRLGTPRNVTGQTFHGSASNSDIHRN